PPLPYTPLFRSQKSRNHNNRHHHSQHHHHRQKQFRRRGFSQNTRFSLALIPGVQRLLLQDIRHMSAALLEILDQQCGKSLILHLPAPLAESPVRLLFRHSAVHLVTGRRHSVVGRSSPVRIPPPVISGNFPESPPSSHPGLDQKRELHYKSRIVHQKLLASLHLPFL